MIAAAISGARWVTASSAAAPTTAQQATDVPGQRPSQSRPANAPSAAPVARDGVSRPPIAPPRRQVAVASGLRTTRAPATASGTVPAKPICAWPLPLPSSWGYATARAPTIANAAGIEATSHFPSGAWVRARVVSRTNPMPSRAAAGPRIAASASTDDENGSGPVVYVARAESTGQATTVATPLLIAAIRIAAGRRLRSSSSSANSAPATGTL